MSDTKRRISPSYKSSTFDTTRDRKKWYKPHKRFKKSQKASRKAKERQCLKLGKEVPKFPKSDVWNWN